MVIPIAATIEVEEDSGYIYSLTAAFVVVLVWGVVEFWSEEQVDPTTVEFAVQFPHWLHEEHPWLQLSQLKEVRL